MSTGGTPFADRLSRRSRYDALFSKYEAAAEVVRTTADTDVQLQPHDQPIAEEEPQQLQRCSIEGHRGTEIQPEAPVSPISRGHRSSVGGVPPMSPIMRRTPAPGSGGGAPCDDHLPTALTIELAAVGRAESGGEVGGVGAPEPAGTTALSGALGSLVALAGLARGGSGTVRFIDHDDDHHRVGEEGGDPVDSLDGAVVHRPHRKHRSEKHKKAPLVSTNWLKVDYRGVDMIIRVDKHKLMHKLGVQARDLRLLDLSTPTPPAILDRDKAIIVNLWHIKAIITLDYCLVVSPDALPEGEARNHVVEFVNELKAKLSTDRKAHSYVGLAGSNQVTANAGYGSLQLPFELKVLEVCLDRVASTLDDSTKLLEREAYSNLDALVKKVSTAGLEHARRIKNRLVRLTKSVESVREVIDRYLNDDGDMHRLHLTGAELSRQVSLRPIDGGRLSAALVPCGSVSVADSDSSSDSSIDEAETAAVEMLLEAYFMQFDHTLNRLQTIHEYIKDTEDLVTIQLDQHRNQLITIDLLLTCLTLGLALMTVVGGYFGMNLDSGLQETPHLFKAVTLTTSLVSLALFVGFVWFLYRQKLLYS